MHMAAIQPNSNRPAPKALIEAQKQSSPAPNHRHKKSGFVDLRA
jgi:hypothetical protein